MYCHWDILSKPSYITEEGHIKNNKLVRMILIHISLVCFSQWNTYYKKNKNQYSVQVTFLFWNILSIPFHTAKSSTGHSRLLLFTPGFAIEKYMRPFHIHNVNQFNLTGTGVCVFHFFPGIIHTMIKSYYGKMSTLLSFCEGKLSVTCGFPSQRDCMFIFDVSFAVGRKSSCLSLAMPLCSCEVSVMITAHSEE